MKKEVDKKPSVDLGYHDNFLSRLEESNIPQIHEPGHISGKYNTEFLDVISRSQRSIRLELRDHLKTHGSIEDDGLGKIVNESDTFTLYAKGQGWFTDDVEKAWKTYKQDYLSDILTTEKETVALSRNQAVPTQPKPSLTLTFLRYTGKKLFDLALYTAVLSPIGYCVYEYLIKPDIKQEVKSLMPYIPTLDEMVGKFKPEIRKELSLYNNQSAENIEKAIFNVLNKYTKKNSLFKKFLPELTNELKKEFQPEKYGPPDKKQEQKQEKPKEMPQEEEIF